MIEQKTRALTEEEKQQLRINRIVFVEQRDAKVNFLSLGFFLFVAITCLLVWYFLNIKWILGLIVLLLLYIWLMIDVHFKHKKSIKKRIELLDELLQKDTINVKEIKCIRAIMFEDAEDLGDYYFLEISDNTLLCLTDTTWEYKYVLPNSHFEIYTDEKLHEVFRKSIRTIGTGFSRIQFSYEVTQYLLDDFLLNYENGEIIQNISFDDFLNKIEEKVKS